MVKLFPLAKSIFMSICRKDQIEWIGDYTLLIKFMFILQIYKPEPTLRILMCLAYNSDITNSFTKLLIIQIIKESVNATHEYLVTNQ